MKFPTGLLTAMVSIGILSGCKKENGQGPFQMQAGLIDQDGYYFDFQPDFILQANEVDCMTWSDSVELDLNGDTHNDVRIFSRYRGFDISGCTCCDCSVLDCMPYGAFGIKKVDMLNDSVQVAADSLGYTLSLDSNMVIDKSILWSSNRNQFLADYNNGPSDSYFKGNWNHAYTRFIGFRFLYPDDTLYGWIRVNPSNTITIMDLALEGRE